MAILGKVQSISGLAYVISDSVQRQLQAGDVLESGGRLVTASDTRIDILLDNGQTVRLGGDLLIPLTPNLDQTFIDDLSQQVIDKSFIRAILQGIERNEDIGDLLEETTAGLGNGSQNTYGFNFVELQITREPATPSDNPNAAAPSVEASSLEPSLFSTPFSQQLYGQSSLFTPVALQQANRAPVAQALILTTFEASPLVSGQMVARDADGDALLFSLAGVPQAGFVLNSDGSYLFDPQAPNYDSMAQGESLTTHYVWQVYDGKGGTDSATLDLTITGVNDAPTVANSLGDQLGIENHVFSYAFPANSFFDVDHGDVLHYTATRIDGTPLPAWLSFDDATRSLSGTPPLTASGTLDIRITATDPYGATAHEDFDLDIANLVLGTSGNNNLVGTADRDYIDALAGNDTLNGGLGADTLVGGTGNDTYVVDDAGDIVIELAGQGTDTVQSSIDYVLADNVERLILTGSDDLQGTGNLLNNTITGNGGNNLIDGGAGNDTMAGGLGDDSYVADSSSDVVTEAASAGIDTVRASASFTLGNNVENLILSGTGDINGTGNTLDNLILGNGGANTLNGGTGNDTMQGGEGDDVYVVNAAGDVVTENANEGVDLIQSSASIASLALNVENLTLTGGSGLSAVGNDLDNVITGNTGNNNLNGGLGDDTINGGNGNDTLNGGLGADSLVGGVGNDLYVLDDAGDTVTELAGQGTDSVQASVSHVLSDNVENLTLTGSANIDATGNDLNNNIVGNAGNNLIDGGLGRDTMAGGAGDDVYQVDIATDVVTEAAASGNDTVITTVTLTLANNVENLTLAGSGNINGTGNTLDNVLTGNAGDNLLNGGAGADTLQGGAGNDTYTVDNIGDLVTEFAGEGNDLVQSSLSYTLGVEIENLTLTGGGAISGTGNALDNQLIGNAAANLLIGGLGNDTLNGANGNDTMQGGEGDDVYVVNTASDVVTENANEGYDTVQSTASLTLAANVESLMLLGTGNINATGNNLDNLLLGNTGNNTLNGSTGADTMQGGLGNDIYVVDDSGDVVTESSGEGTDTIQTSISLLLASNVENLTLTGSSGITGTGNELNNVITGNTANNLLLGGLGNDTLNGGTGNDTMQGGEGDDVYVVNAAGDVVTENANEGVDLIQSSASIASLALNVENLTLTGGSGLSAVGNDLDNVITGNTGNNNLNGGLGDDTINGGNGNDTLNGGLGADSLVGGVGNDLYVLDDAGDTVTELAGQGTDSVQASVSHVLSDNVENLTLTGSANIDATGNDLNNNIVGNAGNNLIDGGLGNDTINAGLGADTLMGGAGNDTLTGGGTGVDVFRWELADRGPLGIPDVDTLTDFAIAPFAAGGDVLDIRDLLVDENQLGGVGNLDDYLHFERSGTDTILHVSHDGGFSGGYAAGSEDLTINILNTDLVGVFVNDNDVINDLLNSQKLLTDMA